MRTAARRDGPHAAIRDLLRKLRWTVEDSGSVGGGMPDLVAHPPLGLDTWWIEVKDGTLPPSERRLRPKQEEFARRWNGRYVVLTCEWDARVLVVPGHPEHARLLAWWLHCKDPRAAAASVGVRL